MIDLKIGLPVIAVSNIKHTVEKLQIGKCYIINYIESNNQWVRFENVNNRFFVKNLVPANLHYIEKIIYGI